MDMGRKKSAPAGRQGRCRIGLPKAAGSSAAVAQDVRPQLIDDVGRYRIDLPGGHAAERKRGHACSVTGIDLSPEGRQGIGPLPLRLHQGRDIQVPGPGVVGLALSDGAMAASAGRGIYLVASLESRRIVLPGAWA